MTIFPVGTKNSLLFLGFLDAFSSTLQKINSCLPWRFNISLHENIYRGDLPTRHNGQFLLYLQHLKSTRFQRFVVKQLSLKIGPVFFFCSHVFSRTYIAKMGRQIVSCQPAYSYSFEDQWHWKVLYPVCETFSWMLAYVASVSDRAELLLVFALVQLSRQTREETVATQATWMMPNYTINDLMYHTSFSCITGFP